jgi:hypothetical protein
MGKRIAVIIILGVLAIGAASWISQPGEDPGLASIAVSNVYLAESAERLKQLQKEHIETLLGDDFKIYQLCHVSPPTTKEHQRLCARIDKKLAAKQAEAKTHPW